MLPIATPTKRKAVDAADSDLIEFTPLGSGREVGRSCHILRMRGKVIMLDCGVHPAFSGRDSLPFLDSVNVEEIDIILISHFHLDHVAALPYLLKNPKFKGRVFMTHPTKSIYKLLLQDFVKVTNLSVDDQLYTEQDLLSSMDKIEVINFHQVVAHNGIRFWSYHAGHVLGAVMFMIEVAGVRVLYTGDYSRSEDRHLMAAEIPDVHPDVLVVEATHGTQQHVPAYIRERMFTEFIHNVVRRGGKCLLPQFALGRAQELLLILDEYWAAHPSLHDVPIYYASSLAKRCLSVYQAYTSMMNSRIQTLAQKANPFVFQHIIALKSMKDFDQSQPCVVMASPGMLQNGLSREILEEWCSDPKNGVMIAGYCVENTLAYTLQASAPRQITTMQGLRVPRLIEVGSVPFTAHSDCRETTDFVRTLQPPHVILVHGNSKEMSSLEKRLLQANKDRNTKVISPMNCQTVEIRFSAQKVVKTAGDVLPNDALVSLTEDAEDPAAKPAEAGAGASSASSAAKNKVALHPRPGASVQGLLVRRDFSYQLMRVQDLSRHTAMQATTIQQRLTVPFSQSFDTARMLLSQMFSIRDEREMVTVADAEAAAAVGVSVDQMFVLPSVVVMEVVTITQIDADLAPHMDKVSLTRLQGGHTLDDHAQGFSRPTGRCAALRVRWSSGPVADMVSDAVVALLATATSSPGAAKLMSEGSRGCCGGEDLHDHGHDHGHSHGHAESMTDAPSAAAAGAEAPLSSEQQASVDLAMAAVLEAQKPALAALPVDSAVSASMVPHAHDDTPLCGHACPGWSRGQLEGLVWMLRSALGADHLGKDRGGAVVEPEAWSAEDEWAGEGEGAEAEAEAGATAEPSTEAEAPAETEVEAEAPTEGGMGLADMLGADHRAPAGEAPQYLEAEDPWELYSAMGMDMSDEAFGITPSATRFAVEAGSEVDSEGALTHADCCVVFSVDGVEGRVFLQDLYVHLHVATHGLGASLAGAARGTGSMTREELRTRIRRLCVGYYLSMVSLTHPGRFDEHHMSDGTARCLARLGQGVAAEEEKAGAGDAAVEEDFEDDEDEEAEAGAEALVDAGDVDAEAASAVLLGSSSLGLEGLEGLEAALRGGESRGDGVEKRLNFDE